jgi:hypothetical protein
VLKIVLVVLAVLVFLGLLGVGSCVYVAYRAKQKIRQFEKQAQIAFPTRTGTREVRTQPAAPTQTPSPETAPVIDLGVPVYPGATPPAGGANISGGEMGGTKVQQYVTDDSVDKVVSFYKDKLGSNAMVAQSGNSALVQLAGSNGLISITIATDQDSGKTKFSITSIRK